MTIKFTEQIAINFEIEVLTGLHVGGNSNAIEIGGIDLPVIKSIFGTHKGQPYIPGSTLKGRMRERLEWLHGLIEVEFSGEKLKDSFTSGEVSHYFGKRANEKELQTNKIYGPTRITVYDAFLKNGDELHKALNGFYTEEKTENTINRITAEANPRNIERVPAGAVFKGRITLNLYEIDVEGAAKDCLKSSLELVFQGLTAIENSFLGGGGSRGNGRVAFKNFRFTKRTNDFFKTGKGLKNPNAASPDLTAEGILASCLEKILTSLNEE
ncbi:type III-A CRISPR-associated RAMP protein Csm3 [bacterium]|nr:type III-A CRISPR-associated RAMP protein Csm3 [bacterium]